MPGPGGSMPPWAGSMVPPLPGWAGSPVPPSPDPGTLSYEAVVAAAVELLNARAVTPHVLRLWEAQPRPGWPWDLKSQQELSFTLEETTCRAPGRDPRGCQGRWLGALTHCQGWVFPEGQQPTVQLSCGPAPPEVSRAGMGGGPGAPEPPPQSVPRAGRPCLCPQFGRTRRSKVKEFFAKIKERFKGFFQCGRIWIHDRLNLQVPKARGGTAVSPPP
ncbi:cathelicidin-B1-like isoform X1 [Pithys albifrons albifrons]|uniref:cathelicidin-B1-like isoform X1 n=1 Tax=Pithys albifrons albifrons TaxID=3385563 RepID=UPI003A5CF6CF